MSSLHWIKNTYIINFIACFHAVRCFIALRCGRAHLLLMQRIFRLLQNFACKIVTNFRKYDHLMISHCAFAPAQTGDLSNSFYIRCSICETISSTASVTTASRFSRLSLQYSTMFNNAAKQEYPKDNQRGWTRDLVSTTTPDEDLQYAI